MPQIIPFSNVYNDRSPRDGETCWAIFEGTVHYGQVYWTDAWAVPKSVQKAMGLNSQIGLFLSSNGHWETTLEKAAQSLLHSSSPAKVVSTGATLHLLMPPKWRETNRDVKIYDEYLLTRQGDRWEVERIKIEAAKCDEVLI